MRKSKKHQNKPAPSRNALHISGFLKNAPQPLKKLLDSPLSKNGKRSKKKSKPSSKKTGGSLLHKFLSTKRGRIRIGFSLVFASFLLWLFWGIPFPTKLGSQDLAVSTKIYDRDGGLIYEIFADERRSPVSLEELPEYVKQSTIAIEDKDFYKHYGFSPTGIARAAYNTLFKSKLQGGSTLTQQLVKNSLLTSERTVQRKAKEFVLSMLVEAIYTKDNILEMYLNQIPYGSTAYGIESASELYFNKQAKQLTLAEAAMLSGMTAAPSRYSPFGAYPELAKGRQEIVLRRMVEDGYITQQQADEAKQEEIVFSSPTLFTAPHFSLWIKEQLAQEYGEAMVEKGGLRVTTTLDSEIQAMAQKTVADEVEKLSKQKVGNGAALVTRPGTGEILAMVGSKDYFAQDEDGKVNIIFSERQPGSSIKPLNYALALRDKRITPATALADIPTCFIVQGQAPYCPTNYDWSFHGATQTRFALGNSYNIPAVRVLALNGVGEFVDFANNMGITSFTDPSRYGLSLTLGGGEVKPADMAIAFGVFANQGVKQPLISILKVEDWKGKVLKEVDLKENRLSGERVLSAEVSFLISHMLLDNNARTAAFGERSYLNVPAHPEVSVKTGTTNDRRDNWTIGYTPQILALSWVGNNDNSSMGGAVSGVSGASPIWNRIMKFALDKAEEGTYDRADRGHMWPQQPEGVVGANVCASTGLLPSGGEESPGCVIRFEYFLEGTIGQGAELSTRDIFLDNRSGTLANEETPHENIEVQTKFFLIDPLGSPICFDCPANVASQSSSIRYPLTR